MALPDWGKLSGNMLDRFTRPTETMYFHDARTWVTQEWGINAGTWAWFYPRVNRHGNGVNAAFLDGHVQFRIFSSIVASEGDVYWDGD